MPFASRFAAARKLVRVEDSDAIMLGRPDAGARASSDHERSSIAAEPAT